jgi:hypothetical protein
MKGSHFGICAVAIFVLSVHPALVLAEFGSTGLLSKSVDEANHIIETGPPVAAPVGSPYTMAVGAQGELVGLSGVTLPASTQSAPQWVLTFKPILNPGVNPLTLGIGGLDAPDYPVTAVTYSQAIGANPLQSFAVPVPLTRRVNFDVTNFMQGLPIHDSSAGQQLSPLFAFRALAANDNVLVEIDGPELSWRDGSRDAPFLPIGPVTGPEGTPTFHFGNRGGSRPHYYDPPVASAFEYQATEGTLFTQIADFPTGFDSPFTVTVGHTVLGQFGPGQSVDLTPFGTGGVSSFVISGISPSVDPTNELAFPLELVFNRDDVSFTMTALPEPSSLVLVAVAVCGLAVRSLTTWRARHLSDRVS